MRFYNKVKWVLGFLLVFVLIGATNLIDRNNFLRVRDSVISIYEDRLIAKNLIIEITKAVHKKELAVVGEDADFYTQENGSINQEIQDHVASFGRTKLVYKEQQAYDQLQRLINDLYPLETEVVASGFSEKTAVFKQIDRIKQTLDKLSSIQLSEGERQLSISKKAIDMVELYTQIEIYILVFLAVIIQIIIMYNPKQKPLEE